MYEHLCVRVCVQRERHGEGRTRVPQYRFVATHNNTINHTRASAPRVHRLLRLINTRIMVAAGYKLFCGGGGDGGNDDDAPCACCARAFRFPFLRISFPCVCSRPRCHLAAPDVVAMSLLNSRRQPRTRARVAHAMSSSVYAVFARGKFAAATAAAAVVVIVRVGEILRQILQGGSASTPKPRCACGQRDKLSPFRPPLARVLSRVVVTERKKN